MAKRNSTYARWLRSGVWLLVTLLSGCGLTQTVVDGTKGVTKAIFYKQIKILHLDFTPRSAVNTDVGDQSSLATMVRVYQLKDRKAFDGADYEKLLLQADTVLKADALASKEVLVMPGGDVSLDMPMEADAQFVAVVALFRHPDRLHDTWRVVLKRDELDPDKPRTLELNNDRMTLLPVKD
jgi:type VI secretion system protein VasD